MNKEHLKTLMNNVFEAQYNLRNCVKTDKPKFLSILDKVSDEFNSYMTLHKLTMNDLIESAK